jgi:hypothetical protein
LDAYNSIGADTITDLNRAYHRVGQPAEIGRGTAARRYDNTVTTLDEGDAAEDNLYYLTQNQQVYAKGVGPVLRRKRRFIYAFGSLIPVPGNIYLGRIRHEALLEYGRLP